MAIEHLDEELALPYNEEAIREGGEALARYMWELVSEIKRVAFSDVRTVVNALVDITNTDWQYWGTRDPNTGIFPDGSWRCGPVDGMLEWQKKVDGTWTRVQRIDAA